MEVMKLSTKQEQAKIWKWMAARLPRRLVYWTVVRAWSYSTTGRYSNSNPIRVTVDDVLRRWELNLDKED